MGGERLQDEFGGAREEREASGGEVRGATKKEVSAKAPRWSGGLGYISS